MGWSPGLNSIHPGSTSKAPAGLIKKTSTNEKTSIKFEVMALFKEEFCGWVGTQVIQVMTPRPTELYRNTEKGKHQIPGL